MPIPSRLETSESEGIPETLQVYIAEAYAGQCDARTPNMFSFVM